jgi:hypothetical protein
MKRRSVLLSLSIFFIVLLAPIVINYIIKGACFILLQIFQSPGFTIAILSIIASICLIIITVINFLKK